MKENASAQANGQDNFKEFVENRWEKSGKTPSDFMQLFSVKSGNFERKELEANLNALFDIIEEMDWSEGDRKLSARAVTKDAFGYENDDDYAEIKRNYNEKDFYTPQGMPHAVFGKQTFNVIGARTGRGKTALSITIMLDMLENTDRDVVFLTFEDTFEQARDKIYLAMLFEDSLKSGNFLPVQKGNRTKAMLAQFFKYPQDCRFYKELSRVRKRFRAYEESGRLQVYDFTNKNICAVEKLCRGGNQGAFVILDYITKIKPRPCYATSRLDGYDDIATTLEELAKTRGLTIIAGAQLRRQDNKVATDSDTPDSLNDTMLKESGRIEEVASTVIFLGRNSAQKNNANVAGHDKGESVFFWKLIKSRDSGAINNAYLFDTRQGSMGYSYMGRFAKPIRADNLSNNKDGKCEIGKAQEEREENDDGAASAPAAGAQYGNPSGQFGDGVWERH